MIPDRKWSPERKWSPNWTANDPEPKMIPDVDRKWSRRKTRNGMEFGFLDFFIILFYFYIYLFSSLNDELDKHKEKIFWRRKLYFKSNSHDQFILFSFDNSSEILLEKKSQLVDSNTISQQARSTTIIA